MRAYELMVIHDGDLDDVQVQDELKDLRSRIDEVATIAEVDFWGRRRFAYEIDHKTEGYYSVIELTAEGGARIRLNERCVSPTALFDIN